MLDAFRAPASTAPFSSAVARICARSRVVSPVHLNRENPPPVDLLTVATPFGHRPVVVTCRLADSEDIPELSLYQPYRRVDLSPILSTTAG
jgi:hypothetical protein